MGRSFHEVDTDNMTAEFSHYHMDNCVLHFDYDGSSVKPSRVTYTKDELDVGKKLNIESVSNGFILKVGNKTVVKSSVYDVESFVRQNFHKQVKHEVAFGEMQEEYDIEFEDMEETLLRMNVAYHAADETEEDSEAA